MLYVTLLAFLFGQVSAYDKIFMGHATNQPGYNFVCHQRTIFNTLGGQINSQKQYYESDLKECNILLNSPPGTQIDFRFTEINIIASNLNTCADASLRIYDGETNATSLLLGFPNGICGQAVPSFNIRSSTNKMLLELHVTSPYTSSFSAIYSAYSPRTSVLCFYCDDLCLPDKSQLCDGLDHCRNGADEALRSCNEQPVPPPKRNKEEEDLKLILIFVLGGLAFIFLVIIIAILVKKKLSKYCLEKRRQRRAAAAANLMLHHPHMYPLGHMGGHRPVARGNSPGMPPGGVGFNGPFMAGPTARPPARPAARGMPRSNMPPPYSSLPEDTINANRNMFPNGNQPNAHDNPSVITDDEVPPHISDDDETPATDITNTVFNYNQRVGNGDTNHPNQRQETSFTETPILAPIIQNSLDTNVADHSSIPSTNSGTVTSDAGTTSDTAEVSVPVVDVTPSTTDSTSPVTDANNSVDAGTITNSVQISNSDMDVTTSHMDSTSHVIEVTGSVADNAGLSLDTISPDTDSSNPASDVTVVSPSNEIDNAPVDVSTRDTIYVIEDLDLGLDNQEQDISNGEVYI